MHFIVITILFIATFGAGAVCGVKFAPIIRAEEEAAKAKEEMLKKIL